MVKIDIYFSSQIKRTMLTHHRKKKKREALSLCIFTDVAVGVFFENVNNSTL